MCRRVIILLIVFVFTGEYAAMTQNNESIQVAFSKIGPDEKYGLYTQWLLSVYPDAECVDLYNLKPADAVKLLETCSGLVLTGGPDIFPGYYKKEKELPRCEKVDRVRDSQEIVLIKKALEMKIPVFAICRGAQLLNVFEGGSLIVDIPGDYGTVIAHRLSIPEGAWHEITVVPKSFLHSIVQTAGGRVNSYHHQAVDKLASCFTPSAIAQDGIIEAYSWKEPEGKSFLIAVQWHPERMTDDAAFSKKLLERFIEEVKKYRK